MLLIAMVLPLAFAACDDEKEVTSVTPTATGVMTDREGNTYPWVRIGGLDWMAANLKSGDPYWDYPIYDQWGDPIIHVDDEAQSKADFEQYGNFYTYEDAVANAPEGWRLPTDDDWKALERAMGVKDVDQMGWRKGGGLAMTDTASLHLTFGGKVAQYGYPAGACRNIRVKEEGCYWTATKDTASVEPSAVFRKVMPHYNKVQRFTTPIANVWMSVRYVRDAK